MQTKLSKTLEGILARVTFDTAKQGLYHHLTDHLTLELIRDEGSKAYHILSTRLDRDALDALHKGLEQELRTQERTTAEEPEHFYRHLAIALHVRFATEPQIDSGHLLIWLAEQHQGWLAQQLLRKQIGPEELIELHASIRQLPPPQLQRGVVDLTLATPNRLNLQRHPFGRDLTEEARHGLIDPVTGRNGEIELMIRILLRRRKNNPMLIGEAGVGKSALVEGLALRMARGEVPRILQGKRLFSMDVAALIAGTKFRGEFEERLLQLLDQLRDGGDTILFIDEIHTIVGAGSTQGSLDIANILKPILARGEIQTIGATTYDEYRRHIEHDAALERRFRRITVDPTSEAETLAILRQLAPRYEEHHAVHYTEESLTACIRLTSRYLTDRQFPDKAIDVLDEAGAAIGPQDQERTVTAQQIEEVITSLTGIPATRLSEQESDRLKRIEKQLSERVIGQPEAIRKVAQALRRSRSGIRNGRRPIGVFLFTGPTGVGKTLLAKELAGEFFYSSQGLIRLDMGEYTERHHVARLIGAPPGYVGYGDGGELTEAVRRNPYAVILFDEIEKAHRELHATLLQLLDEGVLTDGAGRKVDFRNTLIILTSNIGAQRAADAPRSVGYLTPKGSNAPAKSTDEAFRQELEQHFSPEFLGRIDEVIRFRELETSDLEEILKLEFKALCHRSNELGYRLRITPKALRILAQKGCKSSYGARSLRRTLKEAIEDPLSELIIGKEAQVGCEVVIEPRRDGNGVKLKVA